MADQKLATGISEIDVNKAKVLFVLAQNYPTPFDVLMEFIQNAIDAKAPKVVVYSSVYKDDKYFVVEDNGIGMSRESFDRIIANVSGMHKPESPEYEDAKTLGRWGIGLTAPLDKVGYYTLTTAPKAGKEGKPDWEGYTTHDFTAYINDPDSPRIPWQERPDLNRQKPWWNTQVEVRDFGEGGKRYQIINLPRLEKEIRIQFGQKMKENGSIVTIHYIDSRGVEHERVIEPVPFTGTPFPMLTYEGKDVRRVRFTLYRLDEPKGDVIVETAETAYNQSWSKIMPQAVECGMNEALAEDLASGYIEGKIYVDGAKLDTTHARFKEDSAFLEFIILLESWIHNEGRKHLDAVANRDIEVLESEVLDEALKHFKSIWRQDPNVLVELVGILPAAVSRKHIPVDGKETQRATSIEAKGKVPDGGRRKKSEDPGVEHKKRLHIEVVGDEGHERILSDTQIGLRVCYETIPGSRRRFSFDEDDAIFRINKRHADYLRCRDSGRDALRRYVIYLLEFALCALSCSKDIAQHLGSFEDGWMGFRLFELIGTQTKKRKS